MITVKDLGSLTKFQLAKALCLAGRLSWAVDIVEQDILGDKFTSLSNDDKWSVHEWLYEGGIKSVSSEEEIFDVIDNALPRAGKAIAVG